MNQLPDESPGHPDARRRIGLLSWLVGTAILVAVVMVVLHMSEERALIGLLERAEPRWMAAAVLFQAATYFCQSQVWRTVARAGGYRLPLGRAIRLSFAKLFVDQALPTGGISGVTLVAQGLERTGLPRGLVMTSLVVNLISYYAAYVSCLASALAVLAASGHSNGLVWAVAILFTGFAGGLVWGVLRLAGPPPAILRPIERSRFARSALASLRQADRPLLHRPGLHAQAFVWQLLIILLDAGTLWLLLRAMGFVAPVAAVFAAFMTASLLRTIGFVPGGLGTFEAAAVFALREFGVPIPEALSATLLFRAWSFWLPMLPGMIFSRDALGRPKRPGRPPGPECD